MFDEFLFGKVEFIHYSSIAKVNILQNEGISTYSATFLQNSCKCFKVHLFC